MKTNAAFIGLILGLIVIILLQRECGNGCPPVLVPKVDTIYVTVRDTLTISKPVPYAVFKEGKTVTVNTEDTIFTSIPEHVDTARILSDYYVSRLYQDSVRTLFGYVRVLSSVTQNKLLDQKILTDFKIPEIQRTVAAPLRNQVYIGLSIGSNGNTLGFGPELLIRTKRESIYGLGANYLPNMAPSIYYSVKSFWKIHL